MLIARVPARRLPSLGKNHACREIALGYFTAKSIDTRRYGLHLVACKSCEDELILLNNHSVRGVQVLWCVPPGLTRVLGWSDPRAPGTVRPHLPSFCRVVSPHMGTCGLGEQVVWVFVTGGAVLCIRSFHPPQGGTQHPPPSLQSRRRTRSARGWTTSARFTSTGGRGSPPPTPAGEFRGLYCGWGCAPRRAKTATIVEIGREVFLEEIVWCNCWSDFQYLLGVVGVLDSALPASTTKMVRPYAVVIAAGVVQCVRCGRGWRVAPPPRLKRKRETNAEQVTKKKELRERLEKELIDDKKMHTRDISVFFKK